MMLITFGIHLYEKCTKQCILYLSGTYFQNWSNKKKKVTMGSKHTLGYMLPYYSKKSFFFLNLMPKRGA